MRKLNWKSAAQKAKVEKLNRNLAIAVVVWMALKIVPCPAAPPLSFHELKPVAINGAVGKFARSNGVFRLNNSATNEGVYFVAQPFSGNGQISARIRRSADSPVKIGVLFRQDTNVISLFAGMFLAGTNTMFERRSTTKGLPKTTVQTNETAAWLRVVREGNAFSGFYSDDGTNWVQLSADSIEMPDEIFVGLSTSGAEEALIDEVRMTSAKFARPPSDSNFVMPTNILLTANVATLGSGVTGVEFYSGTDKIKEIHSPPFSFLWTNVLAGSHSVTAKITDDRGAEFFSEPFNYEIKLPPTIATFIRVDETTKGNWKGVYGEEGFLIVNDKTNFPSGIQLIPENALPFTWAGTTAADQRALLRAESGERIVSSWNYRHPIILNLSLADGFQRRLTLYFLDCDRKGRTMDVQIWSAYGKLLDRQTVGSFIEGKYLTWLLRGKVIIKIASLGGSNPIVSALFFDPAP